MHQRQLWIVFERYGSLAMSSRMVVHAPQHQVHHCTLGTGTICCLLRQLLGGYDSVCGSPSPGCIAIDNVYDGFSTLPIQVFVLETRLRSQVEGKRIPLVDTS